MDVKTAKKLLREKIWTELETSGFAKFPLPCFGRIPNFSGSEKAADKVRLLKEWKDAKVVFANPDYAQQEVREYALLDGTKGVLNFWRQTLSHVKQHFNSHRDGY